MTNNKLPPFYIGQKVIYITGYNMPKNSIHTVLGISCRECGCWQITIENPPLPYIPSSFTTHVRCSGCKYPYPINVFLKMKRDWQASSFRPVEEIKASIMTFTKVQEKEKQKEKPEILINN